MNSEILGKLVGLMLAHAALVGDSLQEGELLVPTVIYYQNDIRSIESFESETQQEAVILSQQFLDSIPDSIDSWAYVQDGLITLENGEKQDVFFIKAWTRGMVKPIEIYQMYQYQPFTLLDNLKIVNYDETGLTKDGADAFLSALDSGIFSHPSASAEKLQQLFN